MAQSGKEGVAPQNSPRALRFFSTPQLRAFDIPPPTPRDNSSCDIVPDRELDLVSPLSIDSVHRHLTPPRWASSLARSASRSSSSTKRRFVAVHFDHSLFSQKTKWSRIIQLRSFFAYSGVGLSCDCRPLTLPQGHVVTLEITSGVVYRGKLLEGMWILFSCQYDSRLQIGRKPRCLFWPSQESSTQASRVFTHTDFFTNSRG